ncbi:uncharacterized protein LOC121370922 [Gigantopelta aegis]|uniref:uncharacterized protein LOC121370922 n=1 Tax=Gigantopelta aegis TaxID=1735272 RepID=UPI001B888CF8|nr:uncharacterized protein LOC121370922 [Gigantopelta aegis]
MADSEELGLLEVTSCPGTHTIQIITDSNVDAPDAVNEQVNEDFLQAALVEAQDFEPASDQYGDEVVGNEAVSITQEMVHNVVSVSNLVTSAGATVVAEGAFDGATYTVVGEIPETDGQSIIDLQQNVIGVDSGVHMVSEEQAPEQEQAVQNITDLVEADTENTAIAESSANIQFISTPVSVVSPLGSSRNPIRIIQQGNQYTPVQQLTAEQLQQIMQVVQQQQLTKTTADGGGSSVLFNSQTNTKIVYRVIYPSELHKSTGVKGSGQAQNDDGNVQLIHRRPYRKRNREDDDDKVDAPELTKEEKDARKKQRPRTRSGRVSKPPKHMMKDYKHIHVLDWDEDYDDDDGGYSDFKCSDPEAEDREGNKNDHQDESSLDAGYGPLRPKKFKCSTCDKSYIGQGGLARHYRLCPSHGSLDEHEHEKENADGSIGSFSEDSNTRDSFPNPSLTRLTSTPSNSSTQEPIPPTEEAILEPEEVSPAVTPRKIFFGRRGRPRRRNIYLHETPAQRQKRRLREVVKASEDEDLMEIVLPRLVGALTLWEFLLMKVEKGSPSRPHADIIHQEFENLYKTVHKVCKKYLQPCKNSSLESGNQKSVLKIDNSPINKALDLVEGLYEVRDMPMEESSDFQYTYLTDKKSLVTGTQPSHHKVRKTVAVVTSDELISPAKQPKMTSLLSNTRSVANTDTSLPSNKYGSYKSSLISSATPTVTVITKQQSVYPSSTSKAVPSSSQSIIKSVTTSVGTNSLVQTSTQPAKAVFRVVSAQSSITKSQEIPKSQESLIGKTVLISSTNSQTLSANKNSTSRPLVIIGPNSAKFLNNTNIDTSMFQNSIIVNGNSVNMQSRNSAEDKNLASSSLSLGDNSTTISTDINKPCINGVSPQNMELNGASEMMMETSEEPATSVPGSTELEKLANQTVQDMGEPMGNGDSNNDMVQKEQTVMDVNALNNYGDLQLLDKEAGENTQIVTMVQQGAETEPCEILQLDGVQALGGEMAPDFSQASLFQTEDGMYIIQNPDGMAFQLQGAEGIPLETVQALLSMESDSQLQGETIQTEIQQ